PDRKEFVLLSDLVRHFVGEVFPGMKIHGAWPTRITRNSELYIDEEGEQRRGIGGEEGDRKHEPKIWIRMRIREGNRL
ncbi:MAG: hypothetical protein ACKODZ_09875, partial [Verrucomicrobiota bacterium]